MGARDIDFLSDYGVEYIYHMTHIKNLPGILKYGLLPHGNSHQRTDISNQDVNRRRSRRDPIYGKRIHNYVPFYFSPRNAMLYAQYNEDDIVILKLDADLLYGEGVLFTDGNASSNVTEFYDDLSDLDVLDWRCIRARYWNDYSDGRRKKMAEVLVPKKVKKRNIKAILCNNNSTRTRVDALTNEEIDCYVDHRFYF